MDLFTRKMEIQNSVKADLEKKNTQFRRGKAAEIARKKMYDFQRTDQCCGSGSKLNP